MGLETYWEKRDFGRTPEPRGDPSRSGALGVDGALRYVIQKHDATRLHYDFRLEHDGVLLSWAVPKGPSMVPGERRLAVMTEDHPLEYGDFEGTIPEDEYGGGTVMLWDVGSWEPVTRDGGQELDVAAMLARGKLKLILHGERLRGAFTLVRLKGKDKPGDDGERAWLLLKSADEHARSDGDALLEQSLTSITSGRTLEEIAAGSSTWHSHKPRHRVAERGPFVAMPTPVAELPDGVGWIYEPHVAGTRALVRVEAGTVAVTSGGGDDVPIPDALRRALAEVPAAVVIDGVVTAAGLVVASDLLELDGEDLRELPLVARRAALGALIAASEGGRLELAGHTDDREVAATWGDVVAKRLDAPYAVGRTRDWLRVSPDP